jgi:hypothetical protein
MTETASAAPAPAKNVFRNISHISNTSDNGAGEGIHH